MLSLAQSDCPRISRVVSYWVARKPTLQDLTSQSQPSWIRRGGGGCAHLQQIVSWMPVMRGDLKLMTWVKTVKRGSARLWESSWRTLNHTSQHLTDQYWTGKYSLLVKVISSRHGGNRSLKAIKESIQSHTTSCPWFNLSMILMSQDLASQRFFGQDSPTDRPSSTVSQFLWTF